MAAAFATAEDGSVAPTVSGPRFSPEEEMARDNPTEDALGKHSDRGSRFRVLEGFRRSASTGEVVFTSVPAPLSAKLSRGVDEPRAREAPSERRRRAKSFETGRARDTDKNFRGLGRIYRSLLGGRAYAPTLVHAADLPGLEGTRLARSPASPNGDGVCRAGEQDAPMAAEGAVRRPPEGMRQDTARSES